MPFMTEIVDTQAGPDPNKKGCIGQGCPPTHFHIAKRFSLSWKAPYENILCRMHPASNIRFNTPQEAVPYPLFSLSTHGATCVCFEPIIHFALDILRHLRYPVYESFVQPF
jgi:hypothetical protein